ncbi:hypothetical protein ABD91_21310 [Lysinibacillus sphaericus]|nr:hypothetical protein [Lysinibacillus sphaericus]
MGQSIVIIVNLSAYFICFVCITFVTAALILIVNALREKVNLLKYCNELSSKEHIRIWSFVFLVGVTIIYIIYAFFGLFI